MLHITPSAKSKLTTLRPDCVVNIRNPRKFFFSICFIEYNYVTFKLVRLKCNIVQLKWEIVSLMPKNT